MSRILYNRENVITQKYKEGIHNGIDIIGKGKGVPDIIAHSKGKVISVYTTYKTMDKGGTSYGNYVLIDHENGYQTMYAHLKYGSVNVSIGHRVTEGEIIGTMGATGHSTGIHLHFEVRKDGKRIDPTPFINDNLPITKSEVNKTEIKEDNELLNLVKRTIRGDFGNGENRKRKLGDNYTVVMKQVDLNYKHKTTNWDNIKIYWVE